MDNQLNTYGFGASGTAGALAVRNRVLRNTYWLLALSMIPTILGAWIGVATGFNLMAGRPLMGFLIFMGWPSASSTPSNASRTAAWALPCCSASRSSWGSCCRG